MSTFLVTGGCGFIGSHLCDALLARGDTVRVLDDLSSGHRHNLSDGVELIEGDVASPECMISGLYFGLAFGMGGLGAALLGLLADRTSIFVVYQTCAFLPLIGVLTIFLPNIEARRGMARA